MEGLFPRTLSAALRSVAGPFPVVYLNGDERVARANVLQRFEGLPYGPEDLEPSAAPALVSTVRRLKPPSHPQICTAAMSSWETASEATSWSRFRNYLSAVR